MPDRALFEVASAALADEYVEQFRGAFPDLDSAKVFAQKLSLDESVTTTVRGPGAAGLIWLEALYHLGDEIAGEDHA